MTHRRNQRGVTLLEVVIGCGVLLALLAIAVPNTRTMRAPFAVQAASRRLEADVQAARMRSISRNTRYRISVGQEGTAYSVQRETSANVFATEGGLQKMPTGVTITVVSGSVLFDTRGMLVGDVTLSVSAEGAQTRTLSVNVLGQTTTS